MSTLQRVVTLCFVFGSRCIAGTPDGQQLNPLQPALPLGDQSALVCEAGDLLGSGGQSRTATKNLSTGPGSRQVLVELVMRVDADRNQLLDHRELQTLDRSTRQQWLQQFDTNLDRKLTFQELEQELVPKEPARGGYPYPEAPRTSAPPQPEKFRNLRRFGIGIQQTSPTPRSQPFARAAAFGTSPGFRPVTKKPFDQRSEGNCRSPISS